MSGLSLLPVFTIGLLGGAHCVGMCGGIVSAFSTAPGARRIIPVAAARGAHAAATIQDDALRMLSYNLGRIASYAAAGAVAGGLASSVRTLSSASWLQLGGYWFANLVLIALGLHLMDAWRGLARLEAAGQLVWRRVQPMIKRLVPVDSAGKAMALGALWGWVPCGMVYSVLLTAMLSGSAWSGAAIMLAFGLGTMPALVAVGMLGARLQAWTRRRSVRMASGLIVLGFGLLGLLRAANGLPPGWLDTFCLTPPAHSPAGAH